MNNFVNVGANGCQRTQRKTSGIEDTDKQIIDGEYLNKSERQCDTDQSRRAPARKLERRAIRKGAVQQGETLLARFILAGDRMSATSPAVCHVAIYDQHRHGSRKYLLETVQKIETAI